MRTIQKGERTKYLPRVTHTPKRRVGIRVIKARLLGDLGGWRLLDFPSEYARSIGEFGPTRIRTSPLEYAQERLVLVGPTPYQTVRWSTPTP